MDKDTLVLILMLSVFAITGIAILAGSITRTNGKWRCLLTEKQSSRSEKQ